MVTKYDLSPLGPKGWTDVTPIASWGVGVVRGSIIGWTGFLRIQTVMLLLNSARRRFREGGLRFFTAFQRQTLEAHAQDVAATVLLGQGSSTSGQLSW